MQHSLQTISSLHAIITIRQSLANVGRTTIGAIAIVLLVGGTTFAQDADPFEISNSPTSGGGGISSGGEFVMVGSVGQAVTGPTHGGEFEFHSGYLAAECICDQGDANCDGNVDAEDLTAVLSHWGACPDLNPGCEGDLTNDGVVDGSDLTFVLSNWT